MEMGGCRQDRLRCAPTGAGGTRTQEDWRPGKKVMVWTQRRTERRRCEHARQNNAYEGRAEIDVTHAKEGKDFRLLPEAVRKARQRFSPGALRRTAPRQHGRPQEAGRFLPVDMSGTGPCPP